MSMVMLSFLGPGGEGGVGRGSSTGGGAEAPARRASTRSFSRCSLLPRRRDRFFRVCSPSEVSLVRVTADGAVVGLVPEAVRAGVAEAEVPAGEDEGVPHV